MAQGEFTKQELEATRQAVQEIWEALTKNKRLEFFGHLNDILLSLDAAISYAPDKPEVAAMAVAAASDG